MDGRRGVNPETPENPEVPATPENPEVQATPAALESAEVAELSGDESGAGPGLPLPVMPGFREMALRRMAGEQATRMAEDRARLIRELAEQRQAAGLSQTEIAARMGTSQSAVARLE